MTEKELLADLGRRVRARRELMGLAQADLAGRGGPGETTVSRLERGDGAAPRRQTQEQLEKALTLPPGTVRDFLDRRRRELDGAAPNRIPSVTPPLGGTAVHVIDEVLAGVLQNTLNYAAGPGQVLDLEADDPDAARRALLIAGRTPPAYPMTFVHITSGNEYRVDDPGEKNNLVCTGQYQLKHPVPGMNIKVYDPSEHARDVILPDETVGDARLGSATDPVPEAETAPLGQPSLPRTERTRINPDGSVERSPLMPLRWRVVGHLGDEGVALGRALEVLRDLSGHNDDVIRASYHLSRVLQAMADHLDEADR